MATTLSVRIDEETATALDSLAEELSERAGGVDVDRSAAVRVAIKKGIETLMSERPKKR